MDITVESARRGQRGYFMRQSWGSGEHPGVIQSAQAYLFHPRTLQDRRKKQSTEGFLPEPQEAKNRSCPRPFPSLGILSKDFCMDERDCGLWAVRGEGILFP